MRSMRIFGLILTVLVEPAWSNAQPGKSSATVQLKGIEMRAGPSWKMAKTGKLNEGEQVIVHHEDGLWVAILPPPSAVSWINHRFIGEFDPNSVGKQNALVMADNVEIRLGLENGGPSDVSQVKLPRGTLVEIVGPKFKDATTTWYPITSPEGEYRWLPKQALGPATPLAPPPVFVRNTATPPLASPPGSDAGPGTLTSLPSKPTPTAQASDWDKAEQYEHNGNFAMAEKLYTKCYQEMRQKNADPERLLICYNRIIKCQDQNKSDGNPAPVRHRRKRAQAGRQPIASKWFEQRGDWRSLAERRTNGGVRKPRHGDGQPSAGEFHH